MVQLFDSHAHLLFERMGQPDEVLERALQAGVTHVMTVALGPSPAELMESLQLAATRDNLYVAAGLHPHDAARESETFYDALRAHAQKLSVLGEIGLDYHYDRSPRHVQRKVFIRQLELAHELGLAPMMHIRDAYDDAFSILEDFRHVFRTGIVHCFTAGPAEAERFLDLGFHISFSGIVTFKKATDIQEAAHLVPLNKMLVETDSPFLAPVPHRGKVCEPAYVVHTARFISDLRGISFEELAEATFSNALRLLDRQ